MLALTLPERTIPLEISTWALPERTIPMEIWTLALPEPTIPKEIFTLALPDLLSNSPLGGFRPGTQLQSR